MILGYINFSVSDLRTISDTFKIDRFGTNYQANSPKIKMCTLCIKYQNFSDLFCSSLMLYRRRMNTSYILCCCFFFNFTFVAHVSCYWVLCNLLLEIKSFVYLYCTR